jgi:hypothetical protein
MALCSLLLCASRADSAPAAGFRAAPTWVAEDLNLQADAFAAGPTAFAAATNGASGATITVYNHAAPSGRRALARISSPLLKSLGGIAFASSNVLLATENGAQGTAFAISIASGETVALAPPHSIPNPAQVRVRPTDGAIFVVSAGNPGEGAIYRVQGGRAIPFATRLGVGYLGGIGFDRAGALYAADTNDPNFLGLPGRILGLSPQGISFGAVSLAGGHGTGAYDVAVDRQGALYATTGSSITCVRGGQSFALGTFIGDYPFPTDIAVDPDGGVIVNGIYTGVGGLFRLHIADRATRLRSPLP